MSARPRDILQDIRNEIGTAHTGWMRFNEPCIRAYNAALKTNNEALNSVNNAIKLQAAQAWAVLNLLLTGVAGVWVPRLLKPVKQVGDELTSGWVKDTLAGVGDEVQTLIKGTAVDTLKQIGGSTYDPFTPAVESTWDYSTRLNQGVHDRAFKLESAMDALVRDSERWSIAAAKELYNSYHNRCPFITDVPTDTSQEWEKRFQKKAELEMWIEWALARDEKWWRKEQKSFYEGQEERKHMWPILQRLRVLGVPEYLLVSRGSGYLDNRMLLDIVKLIEWAKSARWRANSCRPSEFGVLTIQPNPNVCRLPANAI